MLFYALIDLVLLTHSRGSIWLSLAIILFDLIIESRVLSPQKLKSCNGSP